MKRKRSNVLRPVRGVVATENQIQTNRQQDCSSGQKPPPKRKRVECAICNKNFKGSKGLNIHMRVHTDKRPDICELANTDGDCPSAGQEPPTKRKRVECNICNKNFKGSKGLNIHMRVHTDNRPAVCELAKTDGDCPPAGQELPPERKRVECAKCKKGFQDINGLMNHMRVHTGKPPFVCKQCNKGFQKDSSLKNHVASKHLTHGIGGNDFGNVFPTKESEKLKLCKRVECAICNKGFQDSNGLNNHMRVHNDKRPAVCELAKTEGDCPPAGQEPPPERKRVECAECKKNFQDINGLMNHMRAVHTGKRPFVCKQCNKGFPKDSSLKNHVAAKHPSHGSGGNDFGNMFPTKKPEKLKLCKQVECAKCKKGFRDSNALRKHMRVHSGKRAFVCKQCNKGFRQDSSLNHHVASKHPSKIGDSINELMCNDLGKLFATKEPLNELPVLIHTDDKSNRCQQVFGKGFAIGQQLAQHSGKKPYRCRACKKAFALLTELKLHTKRHPGQKPFVCLLCPPGKSSFSQRPHLKKHLLRIHKTKKPHGSVDLEQRSKRAMPPILDGSMKKYWYKRYSYFSLYDEGIELDQESWYSVTPENLARHHAERMTCDVIIDGFCGAGGNAIQFAMTCNKVIAIDIDPVKIKMAKNNAAIYGVAHKIEFLVGDFLKLAPKLSADVVFLSPPWGGPDYKNEAEFDLETMLLPVSIHDLMAVARRISPSVAAFLPRNSNTDVLSGEMAGNGLEIEENFTDDSKLMALTVYFGDLVKKPTVTDD